MRKIILTLQDKRRGSNTGIFIVKSIVNSIEWKIGEYLTDAEVEFLLKDRPMVTVKIVE